ncbi:MAG: helix-turn-helix transcriptional regulator, partial [Lachnospiraceae bacterium]|nr:helix-turn-helix transcriptional regulator [Lachnospiraceae bacterium]
MLKDIVEKRGYTVYKLAKDAGVPYSTLSDLISGRTDIKKISA